ncbi:MAG: hypothetical protein WCK35_25350 [Chloroflexota bacterium]
MKKEIGVWIDHREANIVVLLNGQIEKKQIISDSGKHLRYSGSSHGKTPEGLKEVTSEDRRDRKFTNELNNYYDDVITFLNEADSILIFGPGEAKIELEKRLVHSGSKAKVMTVESADKLTDNQISAKVREHFLS